MYKVDYRTLTFTSLLRIMLWGVKAIGNNKLRRIGIKLPFPNPPFKF